LSRETDLCCDHVIGLIDEFEADVGAGRNVCRWYEGAFVVSKDLLRGAETTKGDDEGPERSGHRLCPFLLSGFV